MVARLVERLDPCQWPSLSCENPIVHELGAMQSRPFHDEPERARRQVTAVKAKSSDLEHGLVLAIVRMEVWGNMVIEVHLDHDPEEPGDLGHAAPRESGMRSGPGS